ncbi:hypothetical protein [Streptomyces mirabilis]|uniref:hypothetical protein n=1 Tax=Streptomyces mirabilis TaxID=68239 RepID=UPI003653F474
MNSAHPAYHRRVEQVPRAREGPLVVTVPRFPEQVGERRILGGVHPVSRSKAARALRENLREKRCEVIRKEENVLAEAHPVWDVKMLPTEDDPGRRD